MKSHFNKKWWVQKNLHHEEWEVFFLWSFQAAQTYWGRTSGVQPEAAANIGPMYAVSTVAKGVLSVLTEWHLNLKATS